MPSKVRGRRECRVPAGTRGLVCKMHSRMRTRAYRYSRSSPAFPAQWFDGLYRALPGDEFLLPPSPADWWPALPGWALQTSADLTPATGARTTRFCRTHQRQSSARCVRSRTKARPATTTTRPTLPRPPQPAPTFVTMANAPLPGRDGGICKSDLGLARRSIFF